MNCLTPITLPTDDGKGQIVPCGRCNACLLRSRTEWAFRLRQELKHSDYGYFITLTYDNEHLPIKECLDHDTGAFVYVPTVVKRDLQLFFKRLRKRFPECIIRYYAISEYGSERGRPHYHAILFFRCPEIDIDNEEVYQKVMNSWTLGHEVTVSPVTEGRILYITTYCYDHFINPPDNFCEPNFRLISRGRRDIKGLGYDYISESREYLRSGFKFQVYDHGFVNLPRYIRDRVFSEDERREHSASVEYDARLRLERDWAEAGYDYSTFIERRKKKNADYIHRTNKTIYKKKKF